MPEMKAEDLMARILGVDLKDCDSGDDGDSEFEPTFHYLKVSDVPCVCDACLSDDFTAGCTSPFKKYMRTRFVRQYEKQSRGKDRGQNGFDEDADAVASLDDM